MNLDLNEHFLIEILNYEKKEDKIANITAIFDFIDKEKDIDHPEKSLRPIVAGEISNKVIISLSVILLTLSLTPAHQHLQIF